MQRMQRFTSLVAQRASAFRSLPSWTASIPRSVALQSTAAAPAPRSAAGALGQINDMLVRGKDGAGAWAWAT